MMRLSLMLVLLVSCCLPAYAQERLPPIPIDKLSDTQKAAADEYVAIRGPLTGPWHVLLRSPGLINRVRTVSDYVRFNSVLPPRLSEFVILIAARHWSQQYVWHQHLPLALKGGLSPDVAKAIAEGRRPERMADDEAAAYELATELHRTQAVSDVTYAKALSILGERGIVDMIVLTGHYTTMSMVLNTARTGLPPGATPALAPLSR